MEGEKLIIEQNSDIEEKDFSSSINQMLQTQGMRREDIGSIHRNITGLLQRRGKCNGETLTQIKSCIMNIKDIESKTSSDVKTIILNSIKIEYFKKTPPTNRRDTKKCPELLSQEIIKHFMKVKIKQGNIDKHFHTLLDDYLRRRMSREKIEKIKTYASNPDNAKEIIGIINNFFETKKDINVNDIEGGIIIENVKGFQECVSDIEVLALGTEKKNTIAEFHGFKEVKAELNNGNIDATELMYDDNGRTYIHSSHPILKQNRSENSQSYSDSE